MNQTSMEVQLLECTPDEACRYKPYEKKGFPISSEEVYMWKYKNNPDGPARIFIAKSADDNLLGHSVYLPRKLYNLDGSWFLAYQGIDSYLDPEARGKGTLAKMQTMATAAIKEPFFSFPNKIAEKIALRNGRKIYAPLAYDIFPLRLRFHKAQIIRYIPNIILDCVYYGCYFMKYGFTSSDVQLVEVKRFENEYSNKSGKINGNKSKDYLNWRFIDNPSKKYSAFDFVQNGKVLGYIVSTKKGEKIEIYDFLCDKGKEKACLKAFVKWCRKGESSHIYVQSVGYSFNKLGFFRSKSRKNVISLNLTQKNISFMFGDSDWD